MKKLALFLIVPFVLLLGVQTATAQKSTSPRPATSTAQAAWNSYRPETLKGKISMIVVDQKLVILEASGGVPYDITVTQKTKIEINGKSSTFDDLVGQTDTEATITFIARPNGDFAESIAIGE